MWLLDVSLYKHNVYLDVACCLGKGNGHGHHPQNRPFTSGKCLLIVVNIPWG